VRVLFIQASVFALIFFLAGLVIERGHLLKVLLMTAVATAVYVLLMRAMRAMGKKR